MLTVQQLCRKIPGQYLGKKSVLCKTLHYRVLLLSFIPYFLCLEPGLFLEDAELERCSSPDSLVSVKNATNQSSALSFPQESTMTRWIFFNFGYSYRTEFLPVERQWSLNSCSCQAGQEFEAGPSLVPSEGQQQGAPVSPPLCTNICAGDNTA